jgi:hypothetical protein
MKRDQTKHDEAVRQQALRLLEEGKGSSQRR